MAQVGKGVIEIRDTYAKFENRKTLAIDFARIDAPSDRWDGLALASNNFCDTFVQNCMVLRGLRHVLEMRILCRLYVMFVSWMTICYIVLSCYVYGRCTVVASSKKGLYDTFYKCDDQNM